MCPLGHQHGVLRSRDLAEGLLSELLIEHPCGVGKYRVVCSEPLATCSVTGIVNEHFNESLGLVVHGKTHLRKIQRELGCHDYEPIKKRTSMYLGARNPEIRKASEAQAAAAALGEERARTKFRDDPAEGIVINEGD